MRITSVKQSSSALPLLLIVWWLANNVYAIDAEKFFERFPFPHIYIDLTLVQILLGTFLSHVYLTLYPTPTATTTTQPRSQNTRLRFCLPLIIPTLHYFATLLTNISYSTLGSTTTLLWKLSEPASATVLNRLLLHQSPTPISLFGVVLTLFGVLRFSSTAFSLPSFSPIILSNLLFPLRNVCIKLDQHHQTGSHSPINHEHDTSGTTPVARFACMLRNSLPLAAALFIAKAVLQGFHPAAVPYMIRNAALFTAYQLASFILLDRLDALTHSLLNTLKRFTGILLSMLVLSTPLSAPHYQGIAATLMGFILYLGGRKRHKFATSGIALAVVAAFVFMASIATLGVYTPAFPQVSLDFPKDGSVERVTDGEYLVTLVNDYRKNRRESVYKNYDEVASNTNGNVGNLVWQYGAHVALPDFGNLEICESDQRAECAEVATEKGLKHVIYYPQANTLTPDKEGAFSGLANSIKEFGGETLIVGAGVQVEFRQQSNDPEFNSSASITFSTDDYVHPNNTLSYLRLMEKTGGHMLLRGDFSVNVTHRGGLTRAYTIGCPSFWINEDVHLGKTLERKYKAVASRRGDKSLKIAVNLKRMEGFLQQIIYIRDNYPNARFYAQSPGDMVMLRNLEVPFERTRFFTNVEDWVADLKEMDVAYGVRIHGNMISLGAGLPSFIAASDWRVLEMARAMLIPHVTTYDPVFEKDVDVAKMINEMPAFDGDAFDRNRCKIAKIYIKVFAGYGIRVRKHVRQVSELC